MALRPRIKPSKIEPTIEPTVFRVSCVPMDHEDAYHLSITVERRGPNAWAVCRFGECCTKAGAWARESNPSSRTDRYKRARRFPLEQALAIACREAQRLNVNGYSVDEVIARRAQWDAEEAAQKEDN